MTFTSKIEISRRKKKFRKSLFEKIFFQRLFQGFYTIRKLIKNVKYAEKSQKKEKEELARILDGKAISRTSETADGQKKEKNKKKKQ